DNVGKILTKLDELGLAENTLVIFTSDNGGVSKFWKGGMNGSKAGAYEGGVRAPFFARWKETVPAGGVVEAQVSHVDILPTFCELAGVETPADLVLDGKSLVSLLESGSGATHHEYVYRTWDRYFPDPDRRWAVSDQRWKLMAQFGTDATPSPSGWRLYDLENDPGEKNNLIKKEPEITARLREEFVRWFEDVTDGIDYSPIRIPVGHSGEDPVEIEPSWATWEGDQINYTFDGYDWDTIDGWKEAGESATWRLDVLEPGTYRVSLSYGCRPLDAGGTLRLSSGEEEIEHVVEATTTAEQFGVFEAGTIELKEGEVEMRAEVVSAPGKELMRLNGIRLERLR
ncbi:MAG: sulfatase/phosphatase domain-containing protein, partial [Verrucomicrobiota bacterium]